MYQKFKNIHMIGILGSGMCGIAELLLNLGYKVSGSDYSTSTIAGRLTSLGAVIYPKHHPDFVKNADVVVYSSAIQPENEELIAARQLNIPVIRRAEMLAELMRLKYGIVIGGAHGKTTTTSIIATVLTEGGFDPTIIVGGRLNILGSNAKLGQGDFLVAEADESDGSFLKLTPSIAIVTNIDREHLDYFKTLEKIKENFLDFVQKVPFYGAAILCLDDEHVRWLIPRLERRIITYGFSSQAMIKASNIRSCETKTEFLLHVPGENPREARINVPGKHNVLNSLAAVAVARDLEMPLDSICKALVKYQPPDRRFQIKAHIKDILVVDDYGHHPQEISATLQAARESWNRRIVAIFQPHRYTRTRDLLNDFFTVFYDADVLIITNIYNAGEIPIEGIHAKLIAEGVRQHGHQNVHFIGESQNIVTFLENNVRSGDLVITLGAGNIFTVGEQFIAHLSLDTTTYGGSNESI